MPILSPNNKYTNRLNRTLNFAHFNACKNLQLHHLADVACLSKYHFTRTFHDEIGESPISFLRRSQLERAAVQLAFFRHFPINSIATNTGFSSKQSFSRAFSSYFEQCPRKFRSTHRYSLAHSQGKDNNELLINDFLSIGLNPSNPSTFPQISIIKRPAVNLAYIRTIGRDVYVGTNAFMPIYDWANNNDLVNAESQLIGVRWDTQITPEKKRRYDTGITVPEQITNKQGVCVQRMPKGLYAQMQLSLSNELYLKHYMTWFLLVIENSTLFKDYTFNTITGPWFEFFEFKRQDNNLNIQACVPLYLKNPSAKSNLKNLKTSEIVPNQLIAIPNYHSYID